VLRLRQAFWLADVGGCDIRLSLLCGTSSIFFSLFKFIYHIPVQAGWRERKI
jgi:hypothetical protein